MSSNVGNWQWAAGTGCDAALYFRVFNPEIQLKKFDEKEDISVSGYRI
jgi:deoxyribodipyrimidine photo-lyase